MNIETIIIAIALVFIIEGAIPALFPNKWQRYVQKIAQEPTTNIRVMGIAIMMVGALILFVIAP